MLFVHAKSSTLPRASSPSSSRRNDGRGWKAGRKGGGDASDAGVEEISPRFHGESGRHSAEATWLASTSFNAGLFRVASQFGTGLAEKQPPTLSRRDTSRILYVYSNPLVSIPTMMRGINISISQKSERRVKQCSLKNNDSILSNVFKIVLHYAMY